MQCDSVDIDAYKTKSSSEAAFGCSLRYCPAGGSRAFPKVKWSCFFLISNCCGLGQKLRRLLHNTKEKQQLGTKQTKGKHAERQLADVAAASLSLRLIRKKMSKEKPRNENEKQINKRKGVIEVKQKSQNSLKHRMWTTVSCVFRAAEEQKAELRACYWNAARPL